MFGLGFWETVVIILVAVVVIRPEKLPGFMRKAGQLFGKAQAAYDTLRRALNHLDRVEDSAKSPPATPDPAVPTTNAGPYPELRKPRLRRKTAATGMKHKNRKKKRQKPKEGLK